METLCVELEEMKLAMESLTEECRAKSRLSENLKRVNNEQLATIQEAKAKIENQAREIDAKNEEISNTKHMYEDLRYKFNEKESALRHLSFTNENLKASFAEKQKKLEDENKQLVSALDEANVKGEEQDRAICSYKQDIERLKGLLSVSQRKCSDVEQNARAPKEVTRIDEMIAKLERDKGEIEDKLKWRSEQFKHLEDAHDKIQNKFRASKKEWEMESGNLVVEVSSLQTSLDSQTRVAEDLRSKLQFCNQALVREESRRKLLEIQMSESKALYENVMSEYEEARLNIKALTLKRDEEIAELRNSLTTNTTIAKELDIRTTHLELENEELRSALKELREDQINEVGAAASLRSLQKKFRALEHSHRGCSEKLKARDAEWSLERERLNNELDDCLLKLCNKDNELQYLRAELEVSHLSLMHQRLEDEEIYVVLTILKSKFAESCSNLENLINESEQHCTNIEEKIRFLVELLEKKNNDLTRAQAEILRQNETVDLLVSKVEHSESVEHEYSLMQKEIKSYEGMLEESSKKLVQLKEQAIHKENDLLENIKRASVDLDQANAPFTEKINQLSKAEFELEQSKLVLERMEKIKCDLEFELNKGREEILLITRDLEGSLLAKALAEKVLEERRENSLQTLKEKDKKIEEIQQQTFLLEEDKKALEASFLAKLESEKSSGKENLEFLRFVEDMDMKVRTVQTEVDSLKQNYILREVEGLMRLEEEKMKFQQVMEENEKVITGMHQKILSHEQDAQMKLSVLNDTLEKSAEPHILDKHEVYYKIRLIAELEEEVQSLQRKAEFEEKQSFGLKNCVHELKAKIAAVLLEKERVQVQFENELKNLMSKNTVLETRTAELKSERQTLCESIVGFDDLIVNISDKGDEIRRKWDKVVQIVELEDMYNSRKIVERNVNSPSKIKEERTLSKRSPLKEQNC